MSFPSLQVATRGGSGQPFNVLLNGQTVAAFNPTSDSFTPLTSTSFDVATAGNYVLSFVWPATSDEESDFITLVSLSPAP